MFRVRWEETALNELASAWTQANSALRKAITAATNLIDPQLRKAHHQQGESRGWRTCSVHSSLGDQLRGRCAAPPCEYLARLGVPPARTVSEKTPCLSARLSPQ